jgi:hypothetical protein
MAPIAWMAWGRAAFARAAGEDRPILLLVRTAWSRACRDLDRVTLADPAVAALVDRFVPVRVDADRRPDVSERCSLGGWPTLAALTPQGELLGGAASADRDRIHDMLARIDAAYRTRRAEIGEASAAARAERAKDAARFGGPVAAAPDEEAVCALLLDRWDEDYGGFGDAPKFPHPDAVRLLVDVGAERRDGVLLARARRALDVIAAALVDPADGGAFRCAAGRDWSAPETAKLLDANAALLDLFAHAAIALQESRWTAAAGALAGFARARLALDDGGFAASVADDVDPTVLTDANGMMIMAAIRAGAVLGDAPLAELAVGALERVVATYRPGEGVGHLLDAPEPRSLLADHVWLTLALLEAFEATGRPPYEMLAEELMHYCLRVMWDARGGAFFDRAPATEEEAPGVFAERMTPFVANCAAARALARVAAASGDSEFETRARAIVAAAGPHASAQGLSAASFALAVREVTRRT